MKPIEEAYYKILGHPVPKTTIEENKKCNEYVVALIEEVRHKEVNIGQSALGHLKSKLKTDCPSVLDNEILKNKILRSWTYYNDFCINCMKTKFWMLEVDFDDHKKAESLIRKIDEDFPLDLSSSMAETNGLSFLVKNNQVIILIDEKAFKNEERILHEFTHAIQLITGILILDDKIKNEVRDYFNIDDQFADYILDEYEFWVNIYNDLFNGLQKIYWLMNFNKIYSWESFINYEMTSLRNDITNFQESQLMTTWSKIVGKNDIYIRLLATISYLKPDFFNDIIERLKNK